MAMRRWARAVPVSACVVEEAEVGGVGPTRSVELPQDVSAETTRTNATPRAARSRRRARKRTSASCPIRRSLGEHRTAAVMDGHVDYASSDLRARRYACCDFSALSGSRTSRAKTTSPDSFSCSETTSGKRR